MTDFFRNAKKQLIREGMSEDALKQMFSGLKGIVVLDSLGNAEEYKTEIEMLNTGLTIVEVKEVGLGHLKKVLLEAKARSQQTTCV